MKNLMILMFATVFALFSCKKENTTQSASTAAAVPDRTIYSMVLDGDDASIQHISLDELQAAYDAQSTARTPNNQSANGHFTSITGNATYSFSAVQNNGGTNGHVNVNGPEGGWNFEMDTECLEVEENKAVVGGRITQVTSVPPGAESVFIVGNYAYFYVEDHGEGNNAPSDRYDRRLYWSPAALGPLCHLIPPSNSSFWGALVVDVANESDQIQVKD